VPLSIVAYDANTLAETGVEDFSSLAARIPGVTLNSAGPGRAAIRSAASPRSAAIRPRPDCTSMTRPFCLRRRRCHGEHRSRFFRSRPRGGAARAAGHAVRRELDGGHGAVHHQSAEPHCRRRGREGGGLVHRTWQRQCALDAMYNVPLIDDRVALRVVGTYKNFSGFIDRDVGVWAPNPNVPAGFPAYPCRPITRPRSSATSIPKSSTAFGPAEDRGHRCLHHHAVDLAAGFADGWRAELRHTGGRLHRSPRPGKAVQSVGAYSIISSSAISP